MEQIERIIQHIETRAAKSQQDSPAIHLSRDALTIIINSLRASLGRLLRDNGDSPVLPEKLGYTAVFRDPEIAENELMISPFICSTEEEACGMRAGDGTGFKFIGVAAIVMLPTIEAPQIPIA